MVTRFVAIRHGKPDSEGYADELLRPLSKEGKVVQRLVAAQLEEEGLIPTAIFSSPILRAKESAKVMGDYFGKEVTTEEALGYDLGREALLKLLPPPSEGGVVFFVGHAPRLADFVNQLAGEDVLPYGLSKSEAAVIAFSEEIGIGQGEFEGSYL